MFERPPTSILGRIAEPENQCYTDFRHPPGGNILLDASVPLSPPIERRADAVGFKSNLHYLRGIAAVAVVFYHARIFYEVAYGVGTGPTYFPDLVGVYGVAVFFAISGYLMSGLIQSQAPFEFLFKRLIRIYPLFVLATVATIVAHPKIWETYDLASITLAPIGQTRYALGVVEWTLVYEVFFYIALFLIALVGLRRWVPALAAIWFVGLFAVAAMGLQEIRLPTISYLPILPASIGLAGGLLIPHLGKIAPLPALLVAAISIAFANLAHTLALERLAAGIGCVFLIAAAVNAGDVVPSLIKPAFRKLGEWSYALYLIHIPVLFVVFRPEFAHMGHVMVLVGVAVAIAGGAVLGQVDLAVLKRTRTWDVKRREPWVITATALFLVVYFACAVAYV